MNRYSGLYVSGLSFIGLSYLVVYIGAVSIWLLFILMLTNISIPIRYVFITLRMVRIMRYGTTSQS